jgi:hypothetical protein
METNNEIHDMAAQVDAMAIAVYGLNKNDTMPSERELYGIWSILTGIAQKLDVISGYETEPEEDKPHA